MKNSKNNAYQFLLCTPFTVLHQWKKLEFMPPKHAVWPDKKEKKEEPAKAKASSSEASSEESGGAKKR